MKKFMILHFVLLFMICAVAKGSSSYHDLQKMFTSAIAPKPQIPVARFRDEQEKKRRALAKQKKWPIRRSFFRKNNSFAIEQPNFYYPR